ISLNKNMTTEKTTQENHNNKLPDCCVAFSPLLKKILVAILIIIGVSILLPVIFPLAWSLARIIFSLAIIYLGLILVLCPVKKVK
ncbi:hypothetical protein COZ62_00055, partial [Candidatus Berkelbacteria bacterium CG_4_8_14_3_um_filter_39_27]